MIKSLVYTSRYVNLVSYKQWTEYTFGMLCKLGKLQTPHEKIRNGKKTLLNVLLGLYFIPSLNEGLHFTKSWVNLLERLRPGCSSPSSERAISFPLAKVRRDHPLLQQHDEVPLRGALVLRLHCPHHPASSLAFRTLHVCFKGMRWECSVLRHKLWNSVWISIRRVTNLTLSPYSNASIWAMK